MFEHIRNQWLLLAMGLFGLALGYGNVQAQETGQVPAGQSVPQGPRTPAPQVPATEVPDKGGSRLYLGVQSGDLKNPDAGRAVPQSKSTITRPQRDPAGNASASGMSGPLSHQTMNAAIKSVVGVRGYEDNTIKGYGVVTGLGGTGDSGTLVKELLSNSLLRYGHQISANDLSSKNVAVVRVSAQLPAGHKAGRKVDVRVSTVGDATSLQGGVLMECELFDPTFNVVYALAEGALNVGGFSTGGDAGGATKNHPTVGLLPGGGKVVRGIPTKVVDEHGYIMLDAKNGQFTFGNMVAVAEAVNRLYPGAARVDADGSTVKVAVPRDLPSHKHTAYLNTILQQEIETDNVPRVTVNERTGVVVIAGDVRLRPGAIAHGSITVTVAESPEVSQPAPLSDGQTAVVPRTNLSVEEEPGALIPIPQAVTLQEVVDVLNVLGASPRDLISILTAMSDGGLLIAEISRL